MTNYTKAKDKIHVWKLDKLQEGIAKMKDLYYNYDGIVSFKHIFLMEEELKERVEHYERFKELYGGNARGTKSNV